MSMNHLNEFISSVRLAETIEKMKFIINTEMAFIRAELKKEGAVNNHFLLTEIVFLDTIGENVSWAQMYSVQLMANKSFVKKRVGYLATGQLLDESSEVSVLVTQTLLGDIQSPNILIQCLALSFIANYGTKEICTETANTIQKVIKESTKKKVLKKAAMALYKTMEFLPELIPSFKNSFQTLLNSNDNGTIMTGTNCILKALEINPKMADLWKIFINPYTMMLKILVTSKPPQQYAFGVTFDPFLQCKIVKVLSLLNCDSQVFLDLLQEIVTSTDARRNAQRAILYQSVEAIVNVTENSSLRGLGYNQAGRMLSYKDPNILYGALSLFNRVLYRDNMIINHESSDSVALQRYKKHIVRCIDNADSQLRRVALSVILALIDESNVETIVPEMLQYIRLANSDFRAELVNRLYYAVLRYSKDSHFILKSVVDIVFENGDYFGSELITSFVDYVFKHPEIKEEVLQSLPPFLMKVDNQAACQLAAYILGEMATEFDDSTMETMIELLNMPQTKDQSKMMILTALAKLCVRFRQYEKIIPVMQNALNNNNVEIQQRAGELINLLNMPEFAEVILAPTSEVSGEIQENAAHEVKKPEKQETSPDLLLNNLLDLSTPAPAQPAAQNMPDPLKELLSTPVSQPAPAPAPVQQSSPLPPPPNSFVVMKTVDFVIFGQSQINQNNQNQVALMLTVIPTTEKMLVNFVMEFRVPVGWKILPKEPSEKVLRPMKERKPLTQLLYLMSNGAPFGLNIAVSYMMGSQPIREVGSIQKLN